MENFKGFSREERETSLLWDETTGTWDIWTNVPKHIRLFTRMAEAHDVTPEMSPEGRMRVILPEKAVSFRRPSTRQISAEQREASRQRMQELHARRKEQN